MRVVLDADHLERLISPERFATYVAECAGDRERAVALYHWTGRLSGALSEDLRCLEVVYRNTLDQALTRPPPAPRRPTTRDGLVR